MIPEELNSREKIIQWAKVNGYDTGGIDKLVKEWQDSTTTEQAETLLDEY